MVAMLAALSRQIAPDRASLRLSHPGQMVSVCLQLSGYPEHPQKRLPSLLFVRIFIDLAQIGHCFRVKTCWSLAIATTRTSLASLERSVRVHAAVVSPVVRTSSISRTREPPHV